MFKAEDIHKIEELDILVSARNRELNKSNSKTFLTWTFPTNNIHGQGVNYFVIWCGNVGAKEIKTIFFGSLHQIKQHFDKFTEESITKILNK
jgi:hypothetical protein